MPPTPAMDADAALHPILAPQRPHDNLPLADLQNAYCFDTISDRRRLFVNLIVRELQARSRPRTALDIGCGEGMGEDQHASAYVQAVRQHADELWGLEPDTAIKPPAGLFTRIDHALLENSSLPDASVDVAFSHFVMEHVDNPRGFFRRLHQLLKPGGVYLFITPNLGHYFTRTAALLHGLGLDEWVLRRVRGSAVDEYHYPVRYRCNSAGAIARIAQATGFEAPRVGYAELWAGHSYFPRPLRFVHRVLMHKRRWWRQRSALLNLLCAVRKPNVSG